MLGDVGIPGDGGLRPMPVRDWVVVGGGLVLLALSFRPWFGTSVVSSGPYGSGVYETSASAWAASTRWSLAVV